MHIDRHERMWITLSGVLLIVFAVMLGFSSAVLGVRLPGLSDQLLPTAAAGPHDINEGWVRQLAPGRYEVNMRARVWNFNPSEIRIPAGSTVTFYIHSEDIIHGFKIQNTTVSLMIIPGQVAKATYTFTEPGEYLFVCHEYCGAGHHFMSGRVIVEAL
ncbi:MAG: cytochrome C oxidase subunit II [Firmicutes bacterium ZCTH02-B6]|nr:MAG: cytochrome C oxidase subunit II [Firmicutes bacterium ZCTH02-B6]